MEQETLGSDILAGVVVFLVALPLCLGIALASGAPLVSGLVTGVIGGTVVALVGRSPLLVSGPAAGLAAIVIAAIGELGSFPAFLAAVVIAGAMQLALGALRAGRFAALVPSSVVTGMLAAIGVLLILQQSANALGAPQQSGHGLEILLMPIRAVQQLTPGPALVALLGLAVLVAWEYLPVRVRQIVPGALAAVVVGTVASEALFHVPSLGFEPKHRVDLPDFSSGFGSVFVLPDFAALQNPVVWRVAFTLGIVATLESLLSLEATNRMDPWKRRPDPNRELMSQGLGNMLAGFVGGLPMTGVIVRSAANVGAGGRTWKASFTHGILLALAVVAVPWLLEHVPLSVLAAVLLHTGWKLAHPSRFAQARAIGWRQLVPMVTTVVAVVVTDLLIGVLLGLVVSVVVSLVDTAAHGVAVARETAGGAERVRLELAEVASFVHKSKIQETFDSAIPGTHVTVDGRRTRKFDHDVIELLYGFVETARDRGVHYQLLGVPAPVASTSH